MILKNLLLLIRELMLCLDHLIFIKYLNRIYNIIRNKMIYVRKLFIYQVLLWNVVLL